MKFEIAGPVCVASVVYGTRININANYFLSMSGHQGGAVAFSTCNVQHLLTTNDFTGKVISMIMFHLDLTGHARNEAFSGEVQIVFGLGHRTINHDFISISILRIGTPNKPRQTALD